MKYVLLFFLIVGTASAQNGSERMMGIVSATVVETLKKWPTLTNKFAITAVDLETMARGSFDGQRPIYPASVIKLFYLEAIHRSMEDGKTKDTPELRRAMKDMIVLSGNDPTHLILDTLTDTSSGPELPEAEMKVWSEKRNAVNRYFASRGFEKINANQKPWGEGPYGRDRFFVGETYTNRNMLTTDATARLMTEIATLKAVTPVRSQEMLELLARDPSPEAKHTQVKGFTGGDLPAGAKLWSKAGWTSTTRHDAAFVELANGKKFVLVTFTQDHATNTEIIPFVAKTFFANFN